MSSLHADRRSLMLMPLLVAMLASGCPKVIEPQLPAESEVDEPEPRALASLKPTATRAVPGLWAIACDTTRCVWADDRGLTVFDPVSLDPLMPAMAVPIIEPTTLELGPTGVIVSAACQAGDSCSATVSWEGEVTLAPPHPPAQELESGEAPVPSPAVEPAEAPADPATPGPAPQPTGEATVHNQVTLERDTWAGLMQHSGRLPFHRRVPVAGGGMVTYQRGYGQAGGRLMRIGGGVRSVDAPGIDGVSCEGWLAPHPSGLEFYLLLWPQPALLAYDSRSMQPRWGLDLPGPAQGLFVDPAGRYALLSLTAPPDEHRLTDHPAIVLGHAGLADNDALPDDPPDPQAVLLLDLGARSSVAQAKGAFRGWLSTPDGAWILAGSEEIVRLEGR
jgi:hypothetical protein